MTARGGQGVSDGRTRGKIFSEVEGRGIKSLMLRPEGRLELNVSVTY